MNEGQTTTNTSCTQACSYGLPSSYLNLFSIARPETDADHHFDHTAHSNSFTDWLELEPNSEYAHLIAEVMNRCDHALLKSATVTALMHLNEDFLKYYNVEPHNIEKMNRLLQAVLIFYFGYENNTFLASYAALSTNLFCKHILGLSKETSGILGTAAGLTADASHLMTPVGLVSKAASMAVSYASGKLTLFAYNKAKGAVEASLKDRSKGLYSLVPQEDLDLLPPDICMTAAMQV